MRGNKRVYDLICSLGGNCAAAHNLMTRGLGPFSLPFDWVYMLDETPIYKLADCFCEDFKNFLLKENLKPLPEGPNPSHLDRQQYYDTYTGYRFVNHFDLPIEQGGYAPVKEKMDRRIKRLYEYIQKGKTVLFVLSLPFEISAEPVLNLQKTLKQKWPDKKIDFEVIMFDCKQEKIDTISSVCMRYHKRKMNDDDFNKTNSEWHFLNQCVLNKELYPQRFTLFQRICRCFKKKRSKYHV